MSKKYLPSLRILIALLLKLACAHTNLDCLRQYFFNLSIVRLLDLQTHKK